MEGEKDQVSLLTKNIGIVVKFSTTLALSLLEVRAKTYSYHNTKNMPIGSNCFMMGTIALI